MSVEEPSARHGNLLFKEAYGGGLNAEDSNRYDRSAAGYVFVKPMKLPPLYKSRPRGFVVTEGLDPSHFRHIRSRPIP
jgi:hypothetical protein